MKERTYVDDVDRSVYDIKDEENDAYRIKSGLDASIVEKISKEKNDPVWMQNFRLQSLQIYNELKVPNWGPPIDGLNMDDIATYVRPNTRMTAKWSEVPEDIKNTFERLGILKYFTDIVTCSQIGKGKTRPDIYLACADKLGTAPSETLVFEDAVFAAETAHKAGFKTVGVYDESSRNDKNRIKAVCDYYADSFEKAADWGHHLLSL